jgi:putative tricarboxylic transport membrane protein
MVIVASSVFGLFVGCHPRADGHDGHRTAGAGHVFHAAGAGGAAIVTATAMAIFAGDIPARCCAYRVRRHRPPTPTKPMLTKKGQAELALGAGLVFSAAGGMFGNCWC